MRSLKLTIGFTTHYTHRVPASTHLISVPIGFRKGWPMPFTPFSNRTAPFLVALAAVVFAACATEQQSNLTEQARPGKLGTVHFPSSCSNHAQVNFLRGVAALHSFWYEVALDEFRESTTIDPKCIMGYWGEAMAHNHPLWGDPQETEEARKVLTKINNTPKLTSREFAYLQAVQVLYGEGESLSVIGRTLQQWKNSRRTTRMT